MSVTQKSLLLSVVSLSDEPKSECVPEDKPHQKTNTSDEDKSLPDNDNYLMDKFLKESELKQQTKFMRSKQIGVGVLQRSVSLKSLRGSPRPAISSVFHTSSPKSTRNGHLDDVDSFSVLSLDRKTYEENTRQRTGMPLLERKPHYASEVQLSANVLAQFEAKSLYADLKRDSFRARNGTTNFAMNPIFDEQVFMAPPTVHQVPNCSSSANTTPENTTNAIVQSSYRAMVKEEEKEESLQNNDDYNNNIISNGYKDTTDNGTSSPWGSRLSLTAEQELEGKRNCIETSFETLGSIKRRSIKLQRKDFSDDLY